MKTRSEELFEFFLNRNRLVFEKIEEETAAQTRGTGFRPDYLVHAGPLNLVFEVKELAEDENLEDLKTGFTITTGDHIRRRIERSRKQVQYGAATLGLPSVLLIYNNIDQMQLLGTEDRDFITAMYGELTVLINPRTRQRSDWFNGKNQLLQKAKNTSFSAVGRLSDFGPGMDVTLFENVFAKVPLSYEQLPTCFDVKRVEVSTEPLAAKA